MEDKDILILFGTMNIWPPFCCRMPLLKAKILPRIVWKFLTEYFSNIFVAIEMLFLKISVLTGKNACEVFWKIDIPRLEIFMCAFQNSVTNNNYYERNVHLV